MLNNIKKYELTAKSQNIAFEKNQNKTDLWLFNNNCPGPLITANKNDVIEIIFNNQLDEPSAVHWHGIRNINSMDERTSFISTISRTWRKFCLSISR